MSQVFKDSIDGEGDSIRHKDGNAMNNYLYNLERYDKHAESVKLTAQREKTRKDRLIKKYTALIRSLQDES
jgi:hypothetical protein